MSIAISIESTVKFDKFGFLIKIHTFVSCALVVLDFLLTLKKISNNYLTKTLV